VPAGIYMVWEQFVFDKIGAVEDIKPLTNQGYGTNGAHHQKIAGWSPAIQNGRVVKALRKQPVTVVLEEDGLEVYLQKGNYLYIGVDNKSSCNHISKKYPGPMVSTSPA